MNAQTLGPRLAGTLGWEAEYTGCCGHCLLLGGLRCGGPVLPKPGVGLGPQLPVRGEDACVPADRGRSGMDSVQGMEVGDGVEWQALSTLPSLPCPQPHLQPVLLAHLLAGGGLLSAHDVSHQPWGCRRLPASHGPAFCPAHSSRRPQQLGLRQPGLAFPPGWGPWEREWGGASLGTPLSPK